MSVLGGSPTRGVNAFVMFVFGVQVARSINWGRNGGISRKRKELVGVVPLVRAISGIIMMLCLS